MRRNFKVVEINKEFLTVSGGKQWDDSEWLPRCENTDHLRLVEIGDTISAELTPDRNFVTDACLEQGKNVALVKPAPHVPPAIAPWDPNHVEGAPLLLLDGSPLCPADVDLLFRSQAKALEALTARMNVQEALLKSHMRSCICSGGSSGFSR